jgi:predicted RND superfamily exporter protein
MIGIWVVLLAGSVWLATKIDVSTNSLEFLPENHPLRVSERAIQENLGGTAVLNAFIETGGEDSAIEPESLARLARLQAYARSLPETDSTLSVIDYLEPLKLALDAGAIEASTSVPAPLSRTAPEGRVLPKTREEAAELLLIYSHPEDIARYIDEGRSWLRLMLRLNKRSSEDLTRVSKEIQGEAARLGFAPDAVHVASTLRLIADSLDEVAYQMAVSIFTSVSTVFPLLLLLTKSLRAGIIAMIPNTVPSILVFGFMGIFGYKLDVASSTIASITLGIAVDDTIHFLAKFRRLREGGTTMVEALEFGLREGGPAMLFSTGVLSLSLLITNVSGYVPVRSLGQLASFGFFICLMADLTLHPALLAKFAPRKWKGAALPEEVRERARRAEATLSEAIGERISGNWRSFAEAADEAHVSPPRAGAPDMPDTRETPRTAAPPSPVPAERAERGKE